MPYLAAIFTSSRAKKGDAENDRRVDIVIQAAVFQDAPVLKMIGGKVDDLLGCTRHLNGSGG